MDKLKGISDELILVGKMLRGMADRAENGAITQADKRLYDLTKNWVTELEGRLSAVKFECVVIDG